MPWLQLKFTIEQSQAELAETLLSCAEALAVTLQDAHDQPLLEPAPDATPLWGEISVTALFPVTADLISVINWLKQQLPDAVIGDYRIETLEDKDWQRVTRDQFQPIQITPYLWICPSWLTPPDPTAVNVMLDPGLAFGTGSHATTALCLAWLEQNIKPGDVVVDYGCGSGILAIAAAKLQAGIIYAIDYDDQALEATRNNMSLNHCEQIHVLQPNAFAPKQPINCIVANILAQPLIELAPQFAKQIIPGGKIALSGILDQQSEQVRQVYQTWFAMDEPILKEEWVLLSGTRNP